MRDLKFSTLNHPLDVSEDFSRLENTWFIANRALEFDAATCAGQLEWKRYQRKPRMAFDQIVALEASKPWEFPPEYGDEQASLFSLEFITPRTVRLKIRGRSCPTRNDLRSCSWANQSAVRPGPRRQKASWSGAVRMAASRLR